MSEGKLAYFWPLLLPFLPLLRWYERHLDRRICKLVRSMLHEHARLRLLSEGRQYIPR